MMWVCMRAMADGGWSRPGAHLEAARDAEAAEVGAPLVHLARERHSVWVCVLEELQHLRARIEHTSALHALKNG